MSEPEDEKPGEPPAPSDIRPVSILDEMKRSYLDYAMSVIGARALPDESLRMIEEAFGARVFDKYGSREFSGIAYECDAHEGHHVMAESYIVEILKDGASSVYGSDAVAGVVNIFTRRNQNGFNFDAFASAPRNSGGAEYRGSGSWGRTWDGGHFQIAADIGLDALGGGERPC